MKGEQEGQCRQLDNCHRLVIFERPSAATPLTPDVGNAALWHPLKIVLLLCDMSS